MKDEAVIQDAEVTSEKVNEQPTGPTGPQVTPEQVESLIQGVAFWQPAGTTLTVAAVFVKNGSVIIGQSACVSKENFNSEVGCAVALEDAKSQIWRLEGYLLKEKLSGGEVVPLPKEPVDN